MIDHAQNAAIRVDLDQRDRDLQNIVAGSIKAVGFCVQHGDRHCWRLICILRPLVN